MWSSTCRLGNAITKFPLITSIPASLYLICHMGKFLCHHVPETSWLCTVGIPKPITVDNFIQIVDVHYTTYKQCFGNGLSLSAGFFLFLYRAGHLCEYFKNINSCIFRDTLYDGWGDGVILYTSVKRAKSVMLTYSESPRWAVIFSQC